MAVNAAATRPPVQDSAVATRQRRARQAARTDSARAKVSGSNTEYSLADRQLDGSLKPRHTVVECDAGGALSNATARVPVGRAYRKGRIPGESRDPRSSELACG